MVKMRKINNRKRAHLDFSLNLCLISVLTVKMVRLLSVLPRSRVLLFYKNKLKMKQMKPKEYG